MRKSPEESSQTPLSENAKRLNFEQPKGWYRYGRIPYKIYYMLECPDSLVDTKRPGKYKVTTDTGGGKSLSIFVHESVPDEFKDVVAFHELREAELVFGDGINMDLAHQQATKETEEYADKHLTKEKFAKFIEWQATLEY